MHKDGSAKEWHGKPARLPRTAPCAAYSPTTRRYSRTPRNLQQPALGNLPLRISHTSRHHGGGVHIGHSLQDWGWPGKEDLERGGGRRPAALRLSQRNAAPKCGRCGRCGKSVQTSQTARALPKPHAPHPPPPDPFSRVLAAVAASEPAVKKKTHWCSKCEQVWELPTLGSLEPLRTQAGSSGETGPRQRRGGRGGCPCRGGGSACTPGPSPPVWTKCGQSVDGRCGEGAEARDRTACVYVGTSCWDSCKWALTVGCFSHIHT